MTLRMMLTLELGDDDYSDPTISPLPEMRGLNGWHHYHHHTSFCLSVQAGLPMGGLAVSVRRTPMSVIQIRRQGNGDCKIRSSAEIPKVR